MANTHPSFLQLAAREGLQTGTLRDFGDGLNVADDDLNMRPSYSSVMENMIVNDNKGVDIRFGTRLFADGEDGTITDNGAVSLTIDTTNTSNIVSITDTAHGLSTGDHVSMDNFASAIGGIPSTDFDKRHCITVTGVNAYTIRTATVATSTVTAARGFDQIYNTHTISGVIVEKWHFQDHDIVIDTNGELFTVNANGVLARIWDDTFARALAGTPNAWSPMVFASADTFKGELIICNGIDKPLVVDLASTPKVDYLQDAGTSSNVFTPIAKYIKSMPDYVIMAGDPLDPKLLHVSHTGTSGTWQGDPAPNVGTQVDMSRYTPSDDPTVKGLGRYREQLIVLYFDSAVPVDIGTVDSTPAHVITPADAITQHGTIGSRTIQTLGSDLLMCDPSGVPSFARRKFTDSIEVERPSDDIEPMIRNNLLRLSVGELEDNVFSIYNRLDRQYMLFVPNHETNVQKTLQYHALSTHSTVGSGEMYVTTKQPHDLLVGETCAISGAAAFAGLLTGDLNQTFTVLRVLDANRFVVETGGTNTSGGISGGGAAIVLTYQRTESTCYVYKKIQKRKLNAWSVLRGWNWNCASVTSLGRVIFANDRQLFVMGNDNDPIYGDYQEQFDGTWAISTAYTVDDRIKSPTSSNVYICLVDHTSDSSGTMEDNIDRVPTYWTLYEGDAIEFAWELPWIDNQQRMQLKKNKYLAMDVTGEATFNFKVFTDRNYDDGDGTLQPLYDILFAAGVSGAGETGAVSGSARLTGDERPWRVAFDYKISKFRISGSTTKRGRFTSISVAYKGGRFPR